jgi:hypothetical protein
MQGSLARVRALLDHQKPDRPPLFDLIPNDAILTHFNDNQPIAVGDDATALRALARATDASRWSYFSPMAERTEHLPDGREVRYERWTFWTEHRKFTSSAEYEEIKRQELIRGWASAEQPFDTSKDTWYQQHLDVLRMCGEDYFFLNYAPSPGLMAIWTEVGLEAFSYYLADCESVIVEQLELNTVQACAWAAGLPADDPFEAVFIGEDIAFHSGSLVSPRWLAREYYPRLQRVIAAMHARDKKVMFHSDGNLNQIMDGLVGAGIDILNPIEVAAGMDLADLHRRYPKLIYAGGIDVSHLLPFGTPDQVRAAVLRAIDDTEGQILVGSSTEVLNVVPLANYLALRDAVLE